MSQNHTAALSASGRTELDALLRTKIENGDAPGVVAIVANRERTLYHGAFGKQDHRGSIDMQEDTIFKIASMTKPVTSVAVMMLKEQGLLDLDDEAGKYLPELKGMEVITDFDESAASYSTRPAEREVTLRHLMNHTAGFGYPFASHTLNKLSDQLPEPQPLLHDPGVRWTYGLNTRFLGSVVEKIADESLGDFMKTRIFEPLGMTDTGFLLESEKLPRLVSRYKRINGELVGEQNADPFVPNVFGDRGLVGTASDYIRFLQMLIGMGKSDGTRLLTEQSVAEMTQNQIGNLTVETQPSAIAELSKPFPIGAGEDKFGLGFQLKAREESDARSPGSYSWAGLFNTHFWGDPNHGIAAVILTQMLPFYDDRCIKMLTDFENVIYKNLE